MCRRCCNRCNSCGGYLNRGRFWSNCCGNRCDDFLLPMMFWLVRDINRNCRCCWVDRYDRFRW